MRNEMENGELTNHKVNDLNKAIKITTAGEPGAGGAYKYYDLKLCAAPYEDKFLCIEFHEGPIDRGLYGFTNEALLAIVEHRIKGFQSGPFSCRENALALTALQECQNWLNRRTMERQARGVEGKIEP